MAYDREKGYDPNTNYVNEYKYLTGRVANGDTSGTSKLNQLYDAYDQELGNQAAWLGVKGPVASAEEVLSSQATGYPGIEDKYGNPGGGGDDDDDDGDKHKSKKSLAERLYERRLKAQQRQLKQALEEALDDLEADYKKQRTDTYANQMVANLNSNEAMLNSGINSGAVAQAALSSNNALQGNLGQLSLNEARQRSQMQKAYQADLASLQDSLEAEKLNALLEEYNSQKEDDYQAKQDKKAWAWAMWQQLGYATKEIADTLNIPKGTKYNA